MTKIWIIASCCDYEDAHGVFPTREQALARIRSDFDIDFDFEPEDIEDEGGNVIGETVAPVNDTEEFWELCDAAYETGDWKSYQFLEIDLISWTAKESRPRVFPQQEL